MSFYNKTRLQTLFWEIKSRFFYTFLSFLFCFFVSYQNSISLLYLFVLSYDIKEKAFDGFNCNLSTYKFLPFLEKKSIFSIFENKNDLTQNSYVKLPEANDYLASIKSKSICFEEKTNVMHMHNNNLSFSDLTFSFSSASDQDLIFFLENLKDLTLNSITFIFTGVEEAFYSSLLICFVFSFIAILPYIVYAFFCFFIPSLFFYERKKWVSLMIKSMMFWFLFVIYLQNKIIPKLASFLLKFEISSSGFNVEASTKIYSYCVWASTIFVIANFIFLFFFFLTYSVIHKKIDINYFVLKRKWCRVIILLISALLAPPDLFTQFLLAFILIICFETIIYLFFIYKNLTI